MYPRTLVLTNEDLLLFDEEYGKWPLLDNTDGRKQIPKENQFTLVAREAVSDVTGVVRIRKHEGFRPRILIFSFIGLEERR